MGNKISLEDEMINLKITSKQMGRASKKCEKNEKAAIEKLKKVSQLRYIFWSYLINVGSTLIKPTTSHTNNIDLCVSCLLNWNDMY